MAELSDDAMNALAVMVATDDAVQSKLALLVLDTLDRDAIRALWEVSMDMTPPYEWAVVEDADQSPASDAAQCSCELCAGVGVSQLNKPRVN